MGEFEVRGRSRELRDFQVAGTIPTGKSIAAALLEIGVPECHWGLIQASVAGRAIQRGEWGYNPLPGERVDFTLALAGDGGGRIDMGNVRVALNLLFLVGGQLLGGMLGGVPGFFVTFGLTALGTILVTTLIPAPDMNNPSAAPLFSGVQNQVRLNEAIPKLYGTRRIFPDIAAKPYTEIRGDDLYMNVVFCLGYKPMYTPMAEFRIGESYTYQFESLKFEVRNGYDQEDEITLYSNDVQEQMVQAILNRATNWRIRKDTGELVPDDLPDSDDYTIQPDVLYFTTQDETQKISLDLTFIQGLGEADDNSDSVYEHSVKFVVQYRSPDYEGINEGWRAWLPEGVEVIEVFPPSFITIVNMMDSWLPALLTKLEAIVVELEAYPEEERRSTDFIKTRAKLQLASTTVRVGLALIWGGYTGARATMLGDIADAIATLANHLTSQEVNAGGSWTDLPYRAKYADALDIVLFMDRLLTLERRRRLGATDSELYDVAAFKAMAQNYIQHPDIFGGAFTGEFRIRGRQKEPIRKNLQLEVAPGRYEVRIRRVSKQPDDRNFMDDVHVTAFRSIRYTRPFSQKALDKYVLVAMQVKATDEVTGSLNQFNCMATSPLMYSADGETWEGPALVDGDGKDVARNPVFQYIDVLTGSANQEPIPYSLIDWAGSVEAGILWCQENNYHHDQYFTGAKPLPRVAEDMLRVMKGSPLQKEDCYGLVHDIPKTGSVATIALRNCVDFSVTKNMSEPPHALRIRFTNPARSWGEDQYTVYDDGYGDPEVLYRYFDEVTAEDTRMILPLKIERLESIRDLVDGGDVVVSNLDIAFEQLPSGRWRTVITPNNTKTTFEWGIQHERYQVTASYYGIAPEIVEEVRIDGLVDVPENISSAYHSGQVYKLGRFMLKSITHRPEVFQVTQDWEGLVYHRGEQVDIQMDLTFWGIASARILEVSTTPSGGDYLLNSIRLDDAFPMEADGTYEILVRRKDNTTTILRVEPDEGYFHTLGTYDILLSEAALPEPGDLVLLGEPNRITVPCICKEIRYRQNGQVQATFFQASPSIHQAEDGFIPDWSPEITYPPDPELVRPPGLDVLETITDESVMERELDGSYSIRCLIKYRIRQAANRSEAEAASRINTIEVQSREGAWDNRNLASSTWKSGTNYPADNNQLSIVGLRGGETYDFRLRTRTQGGIASEWTPLFDVYIVGKATPPPAVYNLRIQDGVIRWDYQPVRDLAGFLVRGVYGVGGSWDTALPLHDGILRHARFSVPEDRENRHTFFVKSVDEVGNESVEAARLDWDFGYVNYGFLRGTVVHDPGWTAGVKTNCAVSAGQLRADATPANDVTGLWMEDSGLPLWSDTAAPAFYKLYKGMNYEVDMHVSPVGAPASDKDHFYITPELTATNDGEWRLEAKNDNPLLWPSASTEDLWPMALEGDFWPYDGDWHPVRERKQYDLPEDAEWRFRLVARAQNERVTFDTLRFVEHYDVLEERVREAVIAIAGTQVLLDKPMAEVRTVTAQLIQSGTYPTAQRVEVTAKAAAGPTIIVYDGAGASVAGLVDLTVRGF